MTTPIAMTVTELRQALDTRALSAREITSAFLGQIERHRALGAFIEVTADAALQQADAADARLKQGERTPLLGIPIAIKDLICTKGVKTTCASKMLANFIPPYDATVMTALQRAGAVMLGKTNMDEFAMGSSNENSAFGPARNPWDTSRVPGGSSGGSAAAVAACLAPVSLGSDTGGSIRQPAALCNLVGLKPTYGRISRYGLIAFASSLDQIGAFTRTVKDNALITAVLSGKDPLDATSVDRPVPDFVAAVERPMKGLRIGVPREYTSTAGIQPEVSAALQSALTTFKELGATIVEVSLPHAQSGLSAYYIVAPAEAASNLSRFDGIRFGHRTTEPGSLRDLYSKSRSEGFGKEVRRRIMIGTYVLSSGYYDAYYVRAQKVRTLIAKDFEAAFSRDCDVILGPTSPTTAFKIGEKSADPLAMYLNDVFTIPVNLAGLPAMSIPGGFDAAGLPIGLHLIGKPFDEETLFSTAGAYERATNWHTKLPPGILPT